jgi:hypothetical protein
MKLSAEAQELVSAVKRAYQPNDVDRARVLEALRGRLGDAVVLGDAAARSAVGVRRFWSPTSALTVAGLAVVGGGALWLALRTSPASTAAPPSAESPAVAPETVPSATEAPATVPSESPPESVEPPATQSSVTRPAPARRVRDGLSEEVAIMSRAETDLHGGRPERALKALDEHQRKFGNGVLAEERTAARIQALCALGRTAEADAELARLIRLAPSSPHTERALRACHKKQSP